MNRFTFTDALLPAFWLIALALLASGCAAVPESDGNGAAELRAIGAAATDDGQGGPRCPLHHVYVCERLGSTHIGTCYCAREPVNVPPEPGGPRRTF